MTNERLAALIQAGKRDQILPLWNRVERFAAWQARRWRGNGTAYEDLMQVAFIALLDALERYDPERGKFIPWYAAHLKTAFSEALGTRTQRDRRDPINTA